MGAPIRTISHHFYVRLAKPIMFRFSPDSVHETIIKLAKITQRSRFFRWLFRWMWKYTSPALTQSLFGMSFASPVGLSAGFDKNIQVVPLVESIGFGFATVGSVTGSASNGNQKPWFHRLPDEKSILVNAGLPNIGTSAIADRLANDSQVKKRQFPLVISVARTNNPESSNDAEGIADYVKGLRDMRPFADCFEINISCPNTYGGEPFTSPERLEPLLRAIDLLRLTQPVWIKMPSNLSWQDFDKLLTVIVKHQIAAVTISNLRKDRTGIDVDGTVKGNLSGKPTEARSNELIAKTYSKYHDRLTIIGVGGIFNAEDAYRKIKSGASLVALVTGLIFEGPQLPGDISYGLEQLLRADGYDHITQAIGTGVTRYDKSSS